MPNSPASPLRTEMAVSVDVIVLTVRDNDLQVLLVTRGIDPFVGRLALPGGFVLPDEDLPDAALRELREESGVTQPARHLEQLGTYGQPRRDPRGRVVSVAYLVLEPDLPTPVAGTDASEASWVSVADIRPGALAFDHAQILAAGVERARSKLEYTALATAFCPAEFTIAELRRVYEAVWGHSLDPRNFHRKIVSTPGLVEATGTTTMGGRGRPAALFRRATGFDDDPSRVALNPPMLRPTPKADTLA